MAQGAEFLLLTVFSAPGFSLDALVPAVTVVQRSQESTPSLSWLGLGKGTLILQQYSCGHPKRHTNLGQTHVPNKVPSIQMSGTKRVYGG